MGRKKTLVSFGVAVDSDTFSSLDEAVTDALDKARASGVAKVYGLAKDGERIVLFTIFRGDVDAE